MRDSKVSISQCVNVSLSRMGVEKDQLSISLKGGNKVRDNKCGRVIV